ncbi:MAG: polysaccharide deacetylase [Clostridia bacterium]|nr:polysaccharide deacetylase [Clostridia bacterium]
MFLSKRYAICIAVVFLAAALAVILNFGLPEKDRIDFSLYTGADVFEPEANITRKLTLGGDDLPEKTAYLTFDDGPTHNTEIILDVLKQYNAKATFFVLGETAERNSDILLRIFNEGHTIGNHSFSHDYDVVYGTREQFINELKMWEEAVGNIIGHENIVKLLRFPGGSKDEWKYIYRNIAEEMGYKYVDWTALNGDADSKPFSKERCMEEIKKYCTDRGDVVILMHDSAKKTITAEMMPEILEYLIAQGYTFKRIEI